MSVFLCYQLLTYSSRYQAKSSALEATEVNLRLDTNDWVVLDWTEMVT